MQQYSRKAILKCRFDTDLSQLVSGSIKSRRISSQDDYVFNESLLVQIRTYVNVFISYPTLLDFYILINFP